MNIVNAMWDAVAQGSLWAVMTLGVYITYKVMDFPDMSVDGTFALGGSVSAVMIVKGVNPLLALLVSIAAGMCGGFVTGLFHTKLKIPGLLAGILTMLGLYSINMRVMGQSNTSLLGEKTLLVLAGEYVSLSKTTINLMVGVLFCMLLMLGMYWFFGTEVGCALRSTGDNERMARALGVNTDSMKILGLVVANGIVALSGGLVAQSQGFADVSMGTGTLVIGLASIIISTVVFRFMQGNFMLRLLAAVLGSVLYRVIIAVVLQLGLNSNDLKLFSALLVAIALSVPMLRSRITGAIHKKEAA